MKNKQIHNPPYMKDFYRISKERLEAYLKKLGEANSIIRELRPNNDEGKVDWKKVDEAWGKVIDVINSLGGFRDYEDVEAGGEIIAQDTHLYEPTVELDNGKFFDIEFPNGIDWNEPNKNE